MLYVFSLRLLKMLHFFTPFSKGFLLSLGLTSSIGAQNLFVLQQGIARNYVFIAAFLCFLCDCILMSAGVFGIGEVLAKSKLFSLIIAIFGILFCLYYAFLQLKAFLSKENKLDSIAQGKSLKSVILFTLAITLLNPQVYLDTIFLIGAASLAVSSKLFFLFGALSASFLWFFTLAFGAQKLSKYLLDSRFQKALQIFSSLIMLTITFSLCTFILKHI